MILKLAFITIGVLLFAAGLAKYLAERKEPQKDKPRSIYDRPTKRDRIEAHRRAIRYIGYGVGAVIAVTGIIVAWRMWV